MPKSILHKKTEYTENQAVITLTTPAWDLHSQIIIEGLEDDGNMDDNHFFMADFGGRKWCVRIASSDAPSESKKINIGNVRAAYIPHVKHFFKSRPWIVEKSMANLMWERVKEQKHNKNNNPQLYTIFGENSLFASKRKFLQTGHDLLVKIRNIDPNLFKKIYKQSQERTVTAVDDSLLLVKQVIGYKEIGGKTTIKHPRWKTVEALEKILKTIVRQPVKIKKKGRKKSMCIQFKELYQTWKKRHDVSGVTVENFAIWTRTLQLIKNRDLIGEIEEGYLTELEKQHPRLFRKLCSQSEDFEGSENPVKLMQRVLGHEKKNKKERFSTPHTETAKSLASFANKMRDKNDPSIIIIEDQIQEAYKGHLESLIEAENDVVDLYSEGQLANNDNAREFKNIYKQWAFQAGYTDWNVYTPPHIRTFAIWVRVYQLIKLFGVNEMKLMPHNCHTWSAEMLETAGIHVKKNWLENFIAIPQASVLSNRKKTDSQ